MDNKINIDVLSENIANNPGLLNAEKIKQLFEDYANQVKVSTSYIHIVSDMDKDDIVSTIKDDILKDLEYSFNGNRVYVDDLEESIEKVIGGYIYERK